MYLLIDCRFFPFEKFHYKETEPNTAKGYLLIKTNAWSQGHLGVMVLQNVTHDVTMDIGFKGQPHGPVTCTRKEAIILSIKNISFIRVRISNQYLFNRLKESNPGHSVHCT